MLCGLPVALAVLAGIQTDSALSACLQIIPIYIREDGRPVIEFKTQAKFRGEGSDPGRDTEQGHTELCSDGTGSGTSPRPRREPLCPCEVGPLRALPPVTSLSSPRAVCHGAPQPARCQVLFGNSRAPGRHRICPAAAVERSDF